MDAQDFMDNAPSSQRPVSIEEEDSFKNRFLNNPKDEHVLALKSMEEVIVWTVIQIYILCRRY